MERNLFWKLVLILTWLTGSLFFNYGQKKVLREITLEEYFLRFKKPLKKQARRQMEPVLRGEINEAKARELMKQNFPIIINPYVQDQINYLTREKKDFFKKSLTRAQPYLAEMRAIFKKHNLPLELAYLPLIESGFRSRAVSHCGAAGMWQFMSATARWLGMRNNGWFDERLDPIISCEYAARYLKFLYQKFEDWYLVLAAYNYGDTNLKRAIKKAGSRDYYQLIEKKVLPRETRHFVPRFIATLVIINQAHQYGMQVQTQENSFQYLVLPFMSQTHLVAKYSKMSLRQFMHYNSALKTGFIPHADYRFKIRLPEINQAHLLKNMEQLKKVSFNSYHVYYIQSGDNLSSIAWKYQVPQSVLMSINKISNANRIWAGQKLYIPARSQQKQKKANQAKISIYTIHPGETLSHIAYKFGLSVDTIIKLNQIQNPSFVLAGQKIKVYLK